jgi:antitoxin ParD1/3/4
MRTNIDIDDPTLEAAMRAGPFKTKKEAVEAGLKLLARQAAYREILKWEGKLHWDGDDEPGAQTPSVGAAAWSVQESPSKPYASRVSKPKTRSGIASSKKATHGRR